MIKAKTLIIYFFSYSRRIGNTRFYLVKTIADSKDGKPLVGLYYKPIATSGYCGENTPGFPKTVYWKGTQTPSIGR